MKRVILLILYIREYKVKRYLTLLYNYETKYNTH